MAQTPFDEPLAKAIRIQTTLFSVFSILLTDIISKLWIMESVMSTGIPRYLGGIPENVIIRQIFEGFNIVFMKNYGISFGVFNDLSPTSGYQQYVLSGLAILISLRLLFMARESQRICEVTGLGLIIGGALGNAISRIQFGFVVDFLDFHIGDYHWPAFNVADIGITFGALLYGFCLLKKSQEKRKTNDK